MTTINDRLKEYIYAKRLSVNSFSKKIGLSQTTLNQQVNGSTKVSTDVLCAIAENYPDANMRWFLTGEGGMEYNVSDYQSKIDVIGNDTLLNIIKNLQEENASLIRMLSNKT